MSFADKVKEVLRILDLPEGEYCVFGGASLAVRGIRNTNDIDLYVTENVYKMLKMCGWREVSVKKGMTCLVTQVGEFQVEACNSYGDDDTWIPKIQDYIANPEVVGGIPFMPLRELYEWKLDTARDKDLIDVKLIDAHWKQLKKA